MWISTEERAMVGLPSVRRMTAGRIVLVAAFTALVVALVPSQASGASTGARATAGVCTDVVIIGVRGSGEGVEPVMKGKRPPDHKGMGPATHRVAARLARAFEADGSSTRLMHVPYQSLAVFDTFKPTKAQLALLGARQTAAAFANWRSHNVKRYLSSIADGIAQTKRALRSRVAKCPDVEVALVGYSQGAMAIHQALNQLADADDEAVDAVIGSVLVADGDLAPDSAAHRVGGGGTPSGIRTYISGNDRRDVFDPEYTVNVCDAGDIVCDFNLGRLVGWRGAVNKHYYANSEHGRKLLDDGADRLIAELIAPEAAAAATRKCDGVGEEPPRGVDGGWGVYRLVAKNVGCARARRIALRCWSTGVEPRGWTFLSLAPPGASFQLVRGSKVITMDLAGGGVTGCEGRGRYCAREFVIPNDDWARIYARNIRCAVAREVYVLWNTAEGRTKSLPGRGWQCASDGTPNTDHVIAVRCERGRAFVRWIY